MGEDCFERNVRLDALLRSLGPDGSLETRRPDLIFVTGDIANRGKKEEYDKAKTFLIVWSAEFK